MKGAVRGRMSEQVRSSKGFDVVRRVRAYCRPRGNGIEDTNKKTVKQKPIVPTTQYSKLHAKYKTPSHLQLIVQ